MPTKYGPVNPDNAKKVVDAVTIGGGKCIDPMPTTTSTQRGPSCGFYALAFVLRFWHQKGLLKEAPLPARKVDTGATKTSGKPGSLREVARSLPGMPVNYVGEIFSCDAMAKVAETAGYRAVVHKPGNDKYLETVRGLLDRGIPPIVGVDVDADATVSGGGTVPLNNPNNACPGKFGGDNAHWIALVGYAGSNLYQMNWGSYYEFPADDLKGSTDQLRRFKTPKSRVWTKTIAKDGTKGGVRGERWKTDYWTPPHLAGVTDEWIESWINTPDWWVAQQHSKTKKELLGLDTAELVELKKTKKLMASEHKLLLSIVGGERSAEYGKPQPPGFYGYAHKMTSELSDGSTTITTVFPEVVLDLSNQVVEVTPADFTG